MRSGAAVLSARSAARCDKLTLIASHVVAPATTLSVLDFTARDRMRTTKKGDSGGLFQRQGKTARIFLE